MNKVLALIFATLIYLTFSFGLTYYIMSSGWGLQLKSMGVWIWGSFLSAINTIGYQIITKVISED
jgi:hypothetical protein